MSDHIPGLTPDDENALSAAVSLWEKQVRTPVTAAERLKNIRAAQKRTALTPPDPRLRVSRWPAALVAGIMAGMLGLTIAWSGTGTLTPHTPPGTKRTIAGDFTPSGFAGNTTAGLFRRGSDPSENWTAMKPKGAFFAGDWIQNASELDNCEIKIFGDRSIQFWPGTLIRLSQDSKTPGVELWRGSIMVWAKPERPLPVYEMKPEQKKALVASAAGDQPKYFQVEAEGDPAIKVDGYVLLDESKLKALPVTVLKGHPTRKIKPLADSSANLLMLAECKFENKPVSEIVIGLQQLLGVKISLSTAATARVGGQVISFSAKDITASELLAKLAAKLNLNLRVVEGEVLFDLMPGERPAARRENEF